MTGQIVGHYEILEKLGEGGMGVVYKARDRRLDRFVALKFLPATKTITDNIRRRFIQEAKAASALNHPSIIVIHDIDSADGVDYMVMEFVRGRTLASLIGARALTAAAVVDCTAQAADALEAAHAAGIIHRDLKPGNLMITDRGLVKILDFGLAKLVEPISGSGGDATTRTELALTGEAEEPMTRPGVLLGTTAYMSPEQAEGRPLDRRTDIFSLGVVLYEMVTGRRAFQRDSVVSTITAILRDDPPPAPPVIAPLPAGLDAIVARCLRKDPSERFQSMAELKVALDIIRTGRPAAGEAPTVAVAAPAIAQAPASIAVLPFTDLAGDKENEYFCDGLAEEIIIALSRLPGLRVAARTSAFQFRGAAQDLAKIGEQLRVATVLEGGVRRAGNRLRVTARLISIADGGQLWAERFDRQMTDIFELQDEIAQAIADQLSGTLSSGSRQPLVKRHTTSLPAYHAYLEGRYHWYKSTPEGIARSRECFEHAIEIDPNYALAYAGLADYYYSCGVLGLAAPRDAWQPAKAAAERAVALDPMLGEAHAAVAGVYCLFERNWAAAGRAFAKALELSPKSSFVRYLYAMWYLRPLNRMDEAFAEASRILETDPLAALYRWMQAYLFYFRSEFDTAIELSRKTIELEPYDYLSYWLIGVCHMQKGAFADAAEAFERTIQIFGRTPLSIAVLAASYACTNRAAEARAMVAQLEGGAASFYVPAIGLAWAHLALGDFDSAFHWFDRAVDERDPLALTITNDPALAGLHPDGRYGRLLAKLNLVPAGD
jgi:TolB-like protein/Tfp pilus assembly protein PilF/tRNA A-37 threonylcarbamoyl transferase component Bud32